MKLEALSHQGKAEGTSRQVGEKLLSVTKVGRDANESERQVQRYIRLTELLPDLLEMVDRKKIKFNPAVELSYLTPDEQNLLIEVMKEDEVVPSLSQAQQIKRLSQEEKCTRESIHAVLKVPKIVERNVVIKHEIIMQYFSADASDAEIESLIVRLLEENRRKHGG